MKSFDVKYTNKWKPGTRFYDKVTKSTADLRLDRIHTRRDLIHTPLDLSHNSARPHPQLG
jgi:hypothetical protein